MTAAVAPPPVRRSARLPKGWRPRGPWDVCSLGWEVLEWTKRNLPDPRDASKPFVFTREQARRVLRIYELDPLTGRRLHDIAFEEEAKGWGKGPGAAALALVEFGGGGVVFDGWDADGQPMGKPWGAPGLPAPYAQVVAVSEAQTFNVWQQVMILAAGARGDLARVITVDSGRPGRTMLRRRDIPAALMERATASAASRSGAPVTHAVLDEVQLWTDQNGGDDLVKVVLFNLDKTGGWAHFLANAPIRGRGSMAEAWGRQAPRRLFFATRPPEEPKDDWEPERLRAALEVVYRDAPWIDIDRQLGSLSRASDDEDAPPIPWSEVLRFKFNLRVDGGEETWLPAGAWAACAGDAGLDPALPVGVGVRKSAHSDHAAVVVAQKQADGRVVVRCRTFDVEAATGRVSGVALRKHLRELRQAFPRPMLRDPKTRRAIPGPAFAYDRVQFGESAEALDLDGLDMVETNHTAAVMAPPSTLTYELITTRRLVHDGDAELAAQVQAARTVLTERGLRIAPPKDPKADPTHAAVALVMAVAMAVQEAPKPFVRRTRAAAGF